MKKPAHSNIPDYVQEPQPKQEVSLENFKKGRVIDFGKGRRLTLLARKKSDRFPMNLDPELVGKIKNLACSHYDFCLDQTINNNSYSFSCLNCDFHHIQ